MKRNPQKSRRNNVYKGDYSTVMLIDILRLLSLILSNYTSVKEREKVKNLMKPLEISINKNPNKAAKDIRRGIRKIKKELNLPKEARKELENLTRKMESGKTVTIDEVVPEAAKQSPKISIKSELDELKKGLRENETIERVKSEELGKETEKLKKIKEAKKVLKNTENNISLLDVGKVLGRIAGMSGLVDPNTVETVIKVIENTDKIYQKTANTYRSLACPDARKLKLGEYHYGCSQFMGQPGSSIYEK